MTGLNSRLTDERQRWKQAATDAQIDTEPNGLASVRCTLWLGIIFWMRESERLAILERSRSGARGQRKELSPHFAMAVT